MAEEITLCEWKPSLFFFNDKALKSILAFIVLTVLYFFIRHYIHNETGQKIWSYLILILIVIILIQFISHLIMFNSLHFTLTNQRIIRKEGFFTHKTRDIELFRVKDVIMTEPLVLKFFNCGNITLVSTQIDSRLCYFFAVKDAQKIRELIRQTVFERRTQLGVIVRENE